MRDGKNWIMLGGGFGDCRVPVIGGRPVLNETIRQDITTMIEASPQARTTAGLQAQFDTLAVCNCRKPLDGGDVLAPVSGILPRDLP